MTPQQRRYAAQLEDEPIEVTPEQLRGPRGGYHQPAHDLRGKAAWADAFTAEWLRRALAELRRRRR